MTRIDVRISARPDGMDSYQDQQPRLGFFTDTSVCIGCKACEVACKEWNRVPEDGLTLTGMSYDNSVGLGADTWRHVAFIEQQRPVSATARIHSGGGKVTVEVQRASISGVEIDGKTLDFMIQNFVLPFYPDAMVGRPVTMGFHIDRLQVAPAGVGVMIGR